MRQSKRIAQRLSLRCRFKDLETVELTIVDSVKGETYIILVPYKHLSNISVAKASSAKDFAESDEPEIGESVGDKVSPELTLIDEGEEEEEE